MRKKPQTSGTVRELYPQLNRLLRPIIIAHARKLSGALNIPIEDATQEVETALYKGMCAYDYNRSHGNLHRFANTVLRNCAASFIHGELTSTRVPHVVYKDEGKLKVVKYKRMATLEDLREDEPSDSNATPEEALMGREMEDRRARLRMRLLNKLNERELAVFKCLSTPTEAFLMFLRNIGEEEPSNASIAKFLGLGKNAVDYATLTIRTKLTKLAEEEFPELIRGHIAKGRWPMIHVSREPLPDNDFISKTIRERSLDPRPNEPARDIEVAGEYGREIHNYPWGCALIVRKGEEYRTLVIEGRFNPLSGGVNGVDGTWKNVNDVVPWYSGLVRKLGATKG